MKKRAVEDRRVKNFKVKANRRVGKRRQEDKDNVLAYYISLFIGVFVLLVLAVVSVMGG